MRGRKQDALACTVNLKVSNKNQSLSTTTVQIIDSQILYDQIYNHHGYHHLQPQSTYCYMLVIKEKNGI